MTDKLAISAMTQPELLEALARDPVILVPMGSLENQGPQGFMGDYLMSGRIAELTAMQARGQGCEALILPTLPFGCWDAFAGAPGCITLRPAVFRAVVEDILRPLVRHGARSILILNGHSGNVEPIYEVTHAIHQESGVLIPSLYLWKAAFTLLAREIGMEAAAATAGHGANALGSVGMHLFPDNVRRDLAQPPMERRPVMGLPVTGVSSVLFEGVEVDVPVSVRDTTENGVVGGDMRACSPETGAAVTQGLVDIVTGLMLHLKANAPRPETRP